MSNQPHTNDMALAAGHVIDMTSARIAHQRNQLDETRARIARAIARGLANPITHERQAELRDEHEHAVQTAIHFALTGAPADLQRRANDRAASLARIVRENDEYLSERAA